MSFDGLPPDLQNFSSKICLFSLKSRTLLQKMSLSYIGTVNIGHRSTKIGGRKLSNQNGSQQLQIGSDAVKSTAENGFLNTPTFCSL